VAAGEVAGASEVTDRLWRDNAHQKIDISECRLKSGPVLMKILINPRPAAHQSQPLPPELKLIQQPSQQTGLAISVFVGLLIPFVPCMLLSIQSALLSRTTSADETIPWWIVFPVLMVCIVAHELLHLIWHPGGGRSAQSLVLIWPRPFQFGVYYAGFMPRSRWRVMRLSPPIGLTLIPMLSLLLANPSDLSFFWQQFIVLLMLVNGLGAGGDVVAAIIVARQVPVHREIGVWNGRACWKAV
jgi:hypothetical protein